MQRLETLGVPKDMQWGIYALYESVSGKVRSSKGSWSANRPILFYTILPPLRGVFSFLCTLPPKPTEEVLLATTLPTYRGGSLFPLI